MMNPLHNARSTRGNPKLALWPATIPIFFLKTNFLKTVFLTRAIQRANRRPYSVYSPRIDANSSDDIQGCNYCQPT
jgi:hypothetical protein